MAEEEEDEGSKTEEPSQRKLEEARKKGEVVLSREINHWFMIMGATACVALTAGPMGKKLMAELQDLITRPEQFLLNTPQDLGDVLLPLALLAALVLAPVFLILFIAALAGSLLQVGPMWAPDQLEPKLDRISLMQGIERLFSKRSLLEFAKGLLKISIVGVVVVSLLWPLLPTVEHMMGVSIMGMLLELKHLSLRVLGGVLSIMFLIGAIDYLVQRFMFMSKMRMTRSELKEEYKQSEGDPQIKQRIRAIRMERARRRMMAEVPKADVIITNPDHYAVALKYDRAVNPAPVVIAKGTDLMAQKIKEIARSAEVPIVENPPLARALYASTEIDQQIPFEHWKAVAEVISYVYKLKKKR